jgi:CheY-like chemotaxis protein
MPHKLLIADDSVTIQRVIELTFADEDVEVVAVANGQRAIERIKADPPDIVLADTGMPERDGYDVAAFVKADPSLSHIPVVLLTGAFEPLDEKRAEQVGCNGVLVKPFEPQLVISRVRELLGSGVVAPRLESTPTLAREPTPVPQGRAGVASADEAALPAASPPGASAAFFGSDALTTAEADEYFDQLDEAFASLDSPRGSSSAATQAAEAALPAGLGIASDPGVAAGTAQGETDFGDWDLDVSAAGSPGAPGGESLFIAPPAYGSAPSTPGPSATPPAARRGGQAPPVAEETGAGPPALPVRATESPKTAAPIPIVPSAPADAAPLARAFAALLAVEQGAPPTSAPWLAEPRAAITDELVEELTRRVLARLTDRTVRDTVAGMVTTIAERLVRDEIERIKASIK